MAITHQICNFDHSFVAKEDRDTVKCVVFTKEESECYDSYGLKIAQEIKTNQLTMSVVGFVYPLDLRLFSNKITIHNTSLLR